MNLTKTQDILILDDTTREAINSQLSRILSSASFLESPRVSRLLSYVVQMVLSGQAHNIKQYTIAVDALGYPADFDPQTRTAIRVLAGRLRGLLERYYLQEGIRDDIRIEIPKNTYVPVFRLNSVKQDKPETHSPSPIILASIAIIPFNQNPEQSHGTFADDITAAIVTGLTQFRELSIVGPLMKYKDQSVDARNIGQLYRAQFMLEGRVQILGDTLRVRTNLTDCRTGFKMWSQIYEYTHTTHNLFEIEDHITRRIVCDLADHTGIIPNIISKESMQKHLESLKIHEAIYRYEHFLRVLTSDAYYSAVGALEHLTKINPNNAIALAMLSHAYAVNYLFDMKVTNASLEDAERLAQQAIKSDPDCQMAHFAAAFLRFFQGRADQCVAKLRLAILLNPFNAYVISVSGMQLCMLGLWEEGMDLWDKSIQLNPQLQTIYAFVPFMNHYHKGEFEAAWKNAILPNWHIFWVPVMRATAAAQLGLQEQTQDALKELLEMRPDFPSRARELMRRLVYLEDNVEMLLEGLLKAGLKLDTA